MCLGRKKDGGMFTLKETIKRNGLISFEYLMAVFEKAPLTLTPEDWGKLLLWNIFTG